MCDLKIESRILGNKNRFIGSMKVELPIPTRKSLKNSSSVKDFKTAISRVFSLKIAFPSFHQFGFKFPQK